MNYIKILLNGVIKENPTFVLMLGMCPTLATTTSAINGMSMGLATMFVLICSNLVISLIKKLTPDMVRIVPAGRSVQWNGLFDGSRGQTRGIARCTDF